jgi:uncharacterized protein YbcI
MLNSVSTAMVALHKEQFGRGPTVARTAFAGEDTLVTTLENCLVPAETAMVQMGESIRVQESRVFFQQATRQTFIDTVEGIIGRTVLGFASATDPAAEMIWEIFTFEPQDPQET